MKCFGILALLESCKKTVCSKSYAFLISAAYAVAVRHRPRLDALWVIISSNLDRHWLNAIVVHHLVFVLFKILTV